MSRIWKKRDRIYVFDQNTLVLSNRIEDLIFKLQSSIGVHIEIKNIVDAYINKIKEIIDYLDKNNIDYYSDDFTLDSIILKRLEAEVDYAEKELIKAINKTKQPIYKTFAKTNFSKLIIKTNMNNYNKFVKNIEEYNFSIDLDNIIKYKYINMNQFYLKEIVNKDKSFLNHIGRKDLAKYIDNCVSKKG